MSTTTDMVGHELPPSPAWLDDLVAPDRWSPVVASAAPTQDHRLHFQKQAGADDCWRTCIACLLGMPRDDVPHFLAEHGKDYQRATNAWLAAHGLGLATYTSDPFEGVPELRRTVVMVAGGDLDAKQAHAVLWRDGKIFHDPGEAGLPNGPRAFCVLVVLDPRLAGLFVERRPIALEQTEIAACPATWEPRALAPDPAIERLTSALRVGNARIQALTNERDALLADLERIAGPKASAAIAAAKGRTRANHERIFGSAIT